MITFLVRLIPSDDEIIQARAKMESKRRMKKKRSREVDAQEVTADTSTEPVSSSHKSNNRAFSLASGSAAASAPVKSLSLDPLRSAVLAVGKRQDESKVYKDLFHSDRDPKKGEKDLFINVGSFKYGLS